MQDTLTYQEEMRDAKERQKRALFTNTAIILILFLIPALTMFRGADASAFQWEDDHLQISCPDGSSYTVAYADISEMRLEEALDFGECVQGGTEKRFRYGLWRSNELGEYVACAREDFDQCIVLVAGETTYVISYESKDTTAELFRSFGELLVKEGYSFSAVGGQA